MTERFPTAPRRCLAGLFLCLLVAGPAGFRAPKTPGRAHPQDGPDVDVQIEVAGDAVKLRLTFNLAFVDAIVEPFRESMDTVAPAEEDGMREALFEYISKNNVVRVDGVPVPPIDRGFSVDPGNPGLLPLFPEYGARALFKLRILLDYPLSKPPSSVAFFWKPYPENRTLASPEGTPRVSVAAQLFAEGKETLLEFTESEPEYLWHATGEDHTPPLLTIPPAKDAGEAKTIPLLSALLAGLAVIGAGLALLGRLPRRPAAIAGVLLLLVAVLARDAWPLPIGEGDGARLPDEKRALEIFEPLHANIYRAFAYREKEAIYDSLAQSVSGGLLKSLYGQIYRSLILQDEGGAVCRVKDVQPLSAQVETIALHEPSGRPAFSVLARWRVVGSVFHFGHRHTRTNEYHARYRLIHEDAGWRIVDNEILDQKSISAIPEDG